MTKQEEIREGIKLYATGACIYQDGSYPCPINFETNNEVCLDCLMKKLHSQGVVIKVDRELPLSPILNIAQEQRDYLKRAGYVAVVSLIETIEKEE